MTHITRSAMDHPTDDVITHLENCARCRSRVATDVDVAAVRIRILDETAGVSRLINGLETGAGRWRDRPWAVALVAAAAVAALFVPLAWLGLRSSESPVTSAPSATTDTSPVVVLPVRPEEPGPNDGAAPVPPVPSEVASFEMLFTVGDEAVGSLIWGSSTFYEAVRGNLAGESPEYDYGMYRAGTGSGRSDPDNSAFEWPPSSGGDTPSGLPNDPDILWDLLISRYTDLEMWSRMTDGQLEAVAADPTHPDAARAWMVDGFRLEVTHDGIPVTVERPGHPRFEVVSLDRRTIRAGEVGNNTDLPFNYAVFLSTTTTDEQRDVLKDGIVTYADYQAAGAAAAECAGTEAVFDSTTGLLAAPDATRGDCAAKHFDDIAAVWNLASQWSDQTGTEFEQIYYLIEGKDDVVAMYQADEGPERALASGDRWAISISEGGPGYCTRTSAPGSYGLGCFTPSRMNIPNILRIDIGLRFEDDLPTEGYVMGLVAAQADVVTVRFSSAAERDIVPGDIVEFGFRGYGLLFDAADLGTPTELEAYSGETSLGAQTIEMNFRIGQSGRGVSSVPGVPRDGCNPLSVINETIVPFMTDIRYPVDMDFVRPIEAVIPGVQGRVLAVLAETTAELNLRTIARLSGVSLAQVSRVLPALVDLGLVERREAPPSSLFRLVPEHVAAGPLVALARGRDGVIEEMGRVVAALPVTPASVIIFGSFARGEADAESDIDTVVVRPVGVDESDESWVDSIEQWRSQIQRVSGNPVEVLEVGSEEIGARLSSRQPVWRDIRREGIAIHGRSLNELAETHDG